MDLNADLLQIQKSHGDVLYENKLFDNEDYLPPSEEDSSTCSMIWSLVDFLIQCSMFLIGGMKLLTKEGYIETLAPGTPWHETLRNCGLTNNLSVITIFAMCYLNKSKYIGVSKSDSFQYTAIRVLPFFLAIMILCRADVKGNLPDFGGQLVLCMVYFLYFVFVDYKESRRNPLSLFFDNNFNLENDIKTDVKKKTPARMVLIMYRKDGNGGIQGIVLDCYYMDRDGKIANEFYVITDSEEGVLEKIEDAGIKQIHSEI